MKTMIMTVLALVFLTGCSSEDLESLKYPPWAQPKPTPYAAARRPVAAAPVHYGSHAGYYRQRPLEYDPALDPGILRTEHAYPDHSSDLLDFYNKMVQRDENDRQQRQQKEQFEEIRKQQQNLEEDNQRLRHEIENPRPRW